jgi:hypothetical protein
VVRFKITPSVPSGPCSRTSTTVCRKFGSFIDGLATKKTPFSTEDGWNSGPATAVVPSSTVSAISSSRPAIFGAPRKSDC